MIRILAFLAALLAPAVALAQNAFPTPGAPWTAPGAVNMCLNGSLQAVPCSAAFPLPTSLAASAAIIGTVGIDQTTPGTTNGVQVNAALPAGASNIGGVMMAPTSSNAFGITSVVSAAAEGSHVLKGSAGNLYGVVVTTGATGGYLMVFNATSAPADGAVTPQACIQAPANSATALSFGGRPPSIYSTGISVAFSTTGCFTKTVSATAYFSGDVQ